LIILYFFTRSKKLEKFFGQLLSWVIPFQILLNRTQFRLYYHRSSLAVNQTCKYFLCCLQLESTSWLFHLDIFLSPFILFLIKQCPCMYARYVFCCSYSHNVASKGKFIAFVSAQAETDNLQTELKPGIDLLGPVDELFFDTYDRYEPTNDSSSDNCYISTVSICSNKKHVVTSP